MSRRGDRLVPRGPCSGRRAPHDTGRHRHDAPAPSPLLRLSYALFRQFGSTRPTLYAGRRVPDVRSMPAWRSCAERTPPRMNNAVASSVSAVRTMRRDAPLGATGEGMALTGFPRPGLGWPTLSESARPTAASPGRSRQGGGKPARRRVRERAHCGRCRPTGRVSGSSPRTRWAKSRRPSSPHCVGTSPHGAVGCRSPTRCSSCRTT